VTFPLEDVTLAELDDQLAHGRETSESLVAQYLSRMDAIDRRGPALGSVIERNPDARAIARQRDRERRGDGARGHLHGVPVLVKDNYATHDRMDTTAGSLAMVGIRPPSDATVVARLRAAGAVILGKTNMSEWAEFRSQKCVGGWSGRGGQTRNPYVLDRSPMGSSAGSAAAVSANLCAVSIGTETDGSIVLPANNCGVVGLKPTVGLVSRHGVIPVSRTQDTPGVHARSVTDAARVLTVIAGADASDSSTREAERHVTDYVAAIRAGRSVRGLRIGVVRAQLFGNSAPADAAADDAIDVMRRLGAVIVDPANLTTLWRFDAPELTGLACEMRAGFAAYAKWAGAPKRMRSVKDIIAFNDSHKKTEMQYFGQELLAMAASATSLTSATYRAARAANRRLSRTQGIDALMTKHRLDALLAPTSGPAVLIDQVNGDGGSWAVSSPCSIAAVAGYPHISVPMGHHRGLPMGLSFFGRAWSEVTLLRLAAAFERATHHRRPPQFLPTIPIGR